MAILRGGRWERCWRFDEALATCYKFSCLSGGCCNGPALERLREVYFALRYCRRHK